VCAELDARTLAGARVMKTMKRIFVFFRSLLSIPSTSRLGNLRTSPLAVRAHTHTHTAHASPPSIMSSPDFVLPEKWSEGLLDEAGAPMSKT